MALIRAGAFSGMKLDDFVKNKEMESRLASRIQSPYGLDTGGTILNRWQTNFGRIELFTRYRGFDEVAPDNYIQIIIPRTEAGAEPLNADEQPYGWNGKINEHAADAAIWWAFEILTDGEAAEFCRDHRPVVIFAFQEGGVGKRLTVRHDGSAWTVLHEE